MAEARGVWWIRVVTLVLRIILWPLRRLSQIVFPSHDYDGLSAPVTAKAVQAFSAHLRKLAPHNAAISEAFATVGFSALRSDAANTNSLILVYLHSPLHRQADAVCRNLLLNENVLYYLTSQQNLETIGASIHTAQGAYLAQMLGATSYPLLALLQPGSGGSSSSSSMQLVFKAEGPALCKMRPDQLLVYLNTVLQRHQSTMAEAEARRLYREQESELRRQQDEEYHETLRQDQERQRQQEEAENRERERVMQQQEEARQEQEALENKLEQARSLLREEPTSDGTRVRFVLPTGARVERRFHSDETVATLRAFLTVHFHEQEVDITNIGLSTNYPKRSYDENENDQTLEEAGLAPQAVLMVQNLDA